MSSNYLEIGDFIPFITISGINFTKDIHNYCNNKFFFILTVSNIDNAIKLQDLLLSFVEKFNIIVLTKNENKKNIIYKKKMNRNILYTFDEQLNKILNVNDKIKVYITSPNRRIKEILNKEQILNFKINNTNKYLDNNINIPYLIIDNVFSKELLKKIIDFYNQQKNNNKLIDHKHSTKNRSHVYPNIELEKEIDNKLSRNVLQELRKVFYFDAKYRETYKISSYDSVSSGRFHPHRDTVSPYQHRKYAMSLLLNDNYEGGELYFPEYGIKIKPKANTAIIFPGINTHQVLTVTKGSRMAMITFFVNGKTRPMYKFKSHFFDDKNIKFSKIYPS